MSDEVPQKAAWYRYTDSASIGIEIVVSIVICALGAMYLERNVTHWTPWTTLIGVGVGLVVAGRALVRTARNYHKAAAAEAAREAEKASAKDENP